MVDFHSFGVRLYSFEMKSPLKNESFGKRSEISFLWSESHFNNEFQMNKISLKKSENFLLFF